MEESLSVTTEYDVGLAQEPAWRFRRSHTGIWYTDYRPRLGISLMEQPL
jgi:hypothetical protein